MAGSRSGITIRGGSGRTGGRSGATTGGLGIAQAPEAWTTWWAHNRDQFLWDILESDSLRASPGPVTAAGSSLRTRGAGPRRDRPASAIPHAPDRSAVYTRVVPTLLARLESERDGGALAEAALALGRVARAPLDGPVTEALLPLLAHDDARVRQASAVALGLLGSEEGRDVLLELATCSQVGHALTHSAQVPESLRQVAAVAVGLSGDPAGAERLRDLAEGGLNASDALRAHAVVGLGLLPAPADGETAPWLHERSHDRRLPLELQVSLASSLGRVAADGSVDDLLILLSHRDTDPPTRQAAAAALGRVASLDDEDAIAALLDTVEDSKDAATRGLALVSLAHLAATPASAGAHADQRRSIERSLRAELRRPGRSIDRPFIALAAGRLLRDRDDLRDDWGPLLLDAYQDASDPALRGACALALGLGRVSEGAEPLRAAFAEAHADEFAGHVALSLGLMGDQGSTAPLRGSLLEAGRSAELAEDLATALRLLDDPDTVRAVSLAYAQASTAATRDRLAAALGSLRHADALDALLITCADEDLDAPSRATACAALGRLAEKTAAPYTAELMRDTATGHTPAAVAALFATR